MRARESENRDSRYALLRSEHESLWDCLELLRSCYELLCSWHDRLRRWL